MPPKTDIAPTMEDQWRSRRGAVDLSAYFGEVFRQNPNVVILSRADIAHNSNRALRMDRAKGLNAPPDVLLHLTLFQRRSLGEVLGEVKDCGSFS